MNGSRAIRNGKRPDALTTKKNTKAITIGEIKLPRKIPSLNHNLFKGVRVFELIKPSKRNIKDMIKDQTLKSSPFFKGQKATIKKKTKKTIPKLLLELAEVKLFFFKSIKNKPIHHMFFLIRA